MVDAFGTWHFTNTRPVQPSLLPSLLGQQHFGAATLWGSNTLGQQHFGAATLSDRRDRVYAKCYLAKCKQCPISPSPQIDLVDCLSSLKNPETPGRSVRIFVAASNSARSFFVVIRSRIMNNCVPKFDRQNYCVCKDQKGGRRKKKTLHIYNNSHTFVHT